MYFDLHVLIQWFFGRSLFLVEVGVNSAPPT